MKMTRRRVLAGLAATGGIGAFAGSTNALFRSSRNASGALTTGLLDLDLAYWDLSEGEAVSPDPDGTINGPRVAVPVSLADDTSGAVLLRISLPETDGINNPARVWLGATCPPATTLAELLDVTVTSADAAGRPGALIASGSLRDVADRLRVGTPLDADPDTPDVDCLTDELFVLVSYDLGDYVGSETVALPFSVAGVQCRNTDPATNPFGGPLDGPCEPAFACDCCWAIGKVNVDGRFSAGTTYAFDEGLTGYALAVTDTDGGAGVAFDLVTTDGSPALPLCAVHVKGGPGDERYNRTDTYGSSTDVLTGTTDGLVYAPENPNSGERYDISYVLVAVCAPRTADGDCPADLVRPAASVGKPPKSPTAEDGNTDGGTS
jgi:hypothetical protein